MDNAINLKTIVCTGRKEATGFNGKETAHSVVSFLLTEAKARPPKQLQFLFSLRRALWSTELTAMPFSCLSTR